MEKIKTLLYTILLLCISTISAAPLQLNFLKSLQTFQDKTLQDSPTELAKTSNDNVPENTIKTDFQEISRITGEEGKRIIKDASELIIDDSNQDILEEVNLNQENPRQMKQLPNKIQQQNYMSQNLRHSPLSQNQVQHQMFTPHHLKSHEPSMQSNHDMLNPMQSIHNQMLAQQTLPTHQVPLLQPMNEEMLNQMQHLMLAPQNFQLSQEYLPQFIHQEIPNPNQYQLQAPQEYQDPIMNQDMMIPMQDMSLLNHIAMQQQILSLHRLQTLQNLNAMNMLHQQPLLVFLPTTQPKNTEENVVEAPDKTDITVSDDKTNADINYDPESVVIEADNAEKDKMEAINTPHTMIIFPNPNARFSIGEIISGISWLPIEVNVPDTIAWAYNGISNGISGIWSVIGQWPFRRPTPVIQMKMNPNTNMYLKQLTYQGRPMVMMALPENAQFAQIPLMFP